MRMKELASTACSVLSSHIRGFTQKKNSESFSSRGHVKSVHLCSLVWCIITRSEVDGSDEKVSNIGVRLSNNQTFVRKFEKQSHRTRAPFVSHYLRRFLFAPFSYTFKFSQLLLCFFWRYLFPHHRPCLPPFYSMHVKMPVLKTSVYLHP